MRNSLLIFILFNLANISVSQISILRGKKELVIPYTRNKIILDYAALFQMALEGGKTSHITIPLNINGDIKKFLATPNEVISSELKTLYNDVLTYDIISADGTDATGALTLSTGGVYATILNKGKIVSIYPENFGLSDVHIIEYGFQADRPKLVQNCGHDHNDTESGQFKTIHTETNSKSGITIGSKRYNYRLAVVATGEFYKNNGNNDAQVNTVIINTVNAISAIFNLEMSFKLTIGTRIFLYRDPLSDPFIPDESGGESRTVQAGKTVALNFNASGFDIGHVFHQHEDGDGWGSGGIARLRSVCNNFTDSNGQLSKASGWSGSYYNVGNDWVNLVAHEFGHQFGANHTFNGSGGSCTDAISKSNSYEIGSGTTIMAYNGICESDQNIGFSGEADNYFHVRSLEEMFQFVYNGAGGSCGNPVDSPNILPEVDASPCNTSYILPKGTPFYLSAAGIINDNDLHTYCWEQIDEDGNGISPTQGWVGNLAASSTIAPLFRSYPPTSNMYRYFPSLEILSGPYSSNFEVLPQVSRELNFNVTIRDNNPGGGAVASDAVKLMVSNTGPLLLTRPNEGSVFVAGQPEIISWNTNQTNSLCSAVRIKLSTDGGKTFPLVLAENVSYADGNFIYYVPVHFVKTDKARIMVECMDYDCFKFFVISGGDFTISSSCIPENTVLCPTAKITLDEGSALLNLSVNKVIGEKISPVVRPVNVNLATGNIAVKGINGVGCEVSSNNYYYNKVNIYVTETGTYRFKVGGNGFVSIFRSNFNPFSACNSFVSSSAISNGDGTILISSSMEAQLNQCTDYILTFYSYAPILPVNISVEVTGGPGIVMEKFTAPGVSYQSLFVLVNDETDIIFYAGQNTDFRSTPFGNYTLYSLIVDKNVSSNTLIGQQFSNINTNICLNKGLNEKKIVIHEACNISDIVAGQQGICTPGNNFFTQEIVVTYDKAPPTGKLVVNGQLFDITTSPQTVILVDLDANGMPNDATASFTSSVNCKLIKSNLFVAPKNCCPIELELGDDIHKCVGEGTVKLDAGDTTQVYRWSKDGQILATNEGAILFVSSSGLYEVEAIHSSGCKKSDSIRVTYHELPVVSIADNQRFCKGETYTCIANVSGAQSLQWYKDNSLIPGANMSSIQVTEEGTYKILVTGNYNCKMEDETFIQSINIPGVDLGIDIKKCDGEVLVLDAGSEGISYEWYRDGLVLPGENSKIYTALQSGIYRVLVTNSFQCQADDQIKVDFFSSPVIEELPDLINVCQGNSALINITASDYNSLQWYYENNIITGSVGLSLSAFNSGKYSIEASNLAGCKTIKSTRVEVRSLPVVNLGSNIVACTGNPVTLFAGNEGTKYNWKKDNIDLLQNAHSIIASENGVYKVTVTNEYDCMSFDEVTVTFVSGPNVVLSGDTTICEGTNHILFITTDAINPEIKWFRDGEQISDEYDKFLNVNKSGTYEAVVKAGVPACEVRKSAKISFNPKPAFNLGNDRNLCDGDEIPVLDGGSGNTSFSWILNGTFLASTQTVIADKSGIYVLTVRNTFNCQRTEQVKINISSLPLLSMEDQYNLCDGTELTVTAVSNGTKFEWKRENISIANTSGKSLNIVSDGNYTLIVSNDANCKIEKLFLVTTRPLPLVDLGPDTRLCPNDSIVIIAGAHNIYKWSDGSTANILLLNAGVPDFITTYNYNVTVTNEFNCSSSDSIQVILLPGVKATVSSDKPGVCNGQPVLLTASGGTTYTWTDPDGNTLSNLTGASTVANPTKTTTYTVTVEDDICPENKDIKTIQIKIFDPKVVSAGTDTCIFTGKSIKLNASGGEIYQWDNINLIEGPSNVSNPTAKPISETVFSVTITDSNGCEYTDDIKVCIKEDTFKPVNIITPNGDGKNDVLYFGGLDNFSDNKLTIFNRWGNTIFEAKNYQIYGELFNGMRNGERLPSDTYYYILSFDGRIIKSALTILWE